MSSSPSFTLFLCLSSPLVGCEAGEWDTGGMRPEAARIEWSDGADTGLEQQDSDTGYVGAAGIDSEHDQSDDSFSPPARPGGGLR